MKKDSVLIIGDHLMADDIQQQLILRGDSIAKAFSGGFELSEFTEIFILSPYETVNSDNDFQIDVKTLSLVKELAERSSASSRPLVHMLLRCQSTLKLLLSTDLPSDINERFEVYPFTMVDIWAKNIICNLPNIRRSGYLPLDYKAISETSKYFAHIVIFGMNEMAKSIAVNAALSAHFPNYRESDKLPLRSRITLIDKNICDESDTFIASYHSLFENSYYRKIDIKAESVYFHEPMYHDKRNDFVDVEWEFVDANFDNPCVLRKLSEWSTDDRHLLTIFICGNDDSENISRCLSIPREVYEHNIPVNVQQSRSENAKILRQSNHMKNFHIFGMEDCGYDVSLPLVRMAKYLKYFYDCSYGDIGVPTVLPIDEVENAWKKEKSCKMRFSNIYNVMTIAAKMRSLGHNADDYETFYALTMEEIKHLARVEHNRWSVERLIMGSRPCTDEERRVISENIREIISCRSFNDNQNLPEDLKKKYKNERDVHYDLCSYDELSIDATGKNVQVYDYDLTACIPLIIKSFVDTYDRE